MKVRCVITVEIDPDAWTLAFGISGNAAIREDVQEYSRHLLTESLRTQDVLAQ